MEFVESLDFPWVPKDLIVRTELLVEAHHEKFGYAELSTILWHKETMVFIYMYGDLIDLLSSGNAANTEKERNGFFRMIAAIILSFEMLADDFAGWGEACPGSRVEAEDLLQKNLPNARTRLLDTYLPRRSELDQGMLKALGPQ